MALKRAEKEKQVEDIKEKFGRLRRPYSRVQGVKAMGMNEIRNSLSRLAELKVGEHLAIRLLKARLPSRLPSTRNTPPL